MPSSMVLSRSKKVACFPWCSTFDLSSLGLLFLKDEKNSVLSFIAHRSPIHLEAIVYLNEVAGHT